MGSRRDTWMMMMGHISVGYYNVDNIKRFEIKKYFKV